MPQYLVCSATWILDLSYVDLVAAVLCLETAHRPAWSTEFRIWTNIFLADEYFKYDVFDIKTETEDK